MLRRLLSALAATAIAATLLVAAPAPATATAQPSVVQCYGASTFFLMCGHGSPSPLQGAVPEGTTVINHAVGSHRSFAVATKMGVYQLSTGRAVTIPATGSVEIGWPTGLPVSRERFDRLTMRSTIAGIEGILLRGDGAQWRFTRIGRGTATPVPAGTPIVSLEKPLPGAVSIINPGMNNMLEFDQVMQDIRAMVAAHRAVSDAPYWVATLPPAWGGDDTAYGAARLRINAAIRTTYGEHVAPFGEYLLNGALADAGIVPTAEDRRRSAAGITPQSFQLSASDWTHHNEAGRAIGARFLAGFLAGATTTASAYARFDARASLTATTRHDVIEIAGWAFDGSDVHQRIAVSVSVDGERRGTLNATGPSADLRRYGVPGSHGFAWSTAASDGPHRVCVTAIGFWAGENSAPKCATVTVARYASPDRVTGSDRYDTAARLAGIHYPDGAATVYVASGQLFADAPSAAAAAAHESAPLMLTQRTALPRATADAIRRLRPASITLVGGTPTVSSAVERSLAALAPVTRIAGANRYETSAMLATHAFATADHAMIATGRNFADALAAGPVAAQRSAPVLLVDGRGQPAESTRAALTELAVETLTIVGGTPSVSDTTAAGLSADRAVDRISGATRYETAALLSRVFATTPSGVYIASGAQFPDALAASAVAGASGIPLLLTPATCMHPSVFGEIERLGRPALTLIGGTPTLSDRVARFHRC